MLPQFSFLTLAAFLVLMITCSCTGLGGEVSLPGKTPLCEELRGNDVRCYSTKKRPSSDTISPLPDNDSDVRAFFKNGCMLPALYGSDDCICWCCNWQNLCHPLKLKPCKQYTTVLLMGLPGLKYCPMTRIVARSGNHFFHAFKNSTF